MYIAVWRLGCVSAKTYSFGQESICRSEYAAHIVHAADIVQYDQDGVLGRLLEFIYRFSPQFVHTQFAHGTKVTPAVHKMYRDDSPIFVAMSKSTADTPLMQQHRAIKQRYPDAVLLFRVGDFYETFGEDAIIASKVLGITLTKRNNGAAASSELAGFPHHALDTYLHKLVKAGHRVAICDQLEDPKSVKGIVKRGVTEMVTPGVATNDKLLEQNSNNFLAAIHFTDQANSGAAFLDISTGEFFVAEGNQEYIDKLLQSLRPAEVIF